MENRNFYNEILTEYNLRPAYKHDLPDANLVLKGVNSSCGDDIQSKLKVGEGMTRDGALVGDGCAVSQAPADMMLDLVVGKKREEAVELAENLLNMIRGTVKEEELQAPEEVLALRDIPHMPARAERAMLGWRTLSEMLEESMR